MTIVGYRFTPYSIGRGYRRKGFHIYNPDVVKATNLYLTGRYKINLSIIHLNVHTLDRDESLSGKKALLCFGNLLEARMSSKKIRFKIEKIVRKLGGINGRRKN